MMTPRLHEPFATGARTLIVACAEQDAYDPTWRYLLRRHALVLRTHGAEAPADASSPLAAALRAHPIERVLVLGHLGCRARDGVRIEPAPNTAAVAAFCRYASAASALAKRRARGELAREEFAEKLDVLVRLANLEACAELHAALRGGSVTAHAAVYDPATRQVELFDGAGFCPIDREAVCRLITGVKSATAVHEHHFARAQYAPAYGAAPAHGAQPGGLP